ncbi:MAG TPA: cyclic nucleotide-binding domain-containing protein [Trichocoleus sp.]
MLEPARSIEFFYKLSEPQSVAPGEVIFKQGETGEVMYGILEGEVELWVNDKVAEVIRAGDVFGEGALVQDERNRASTAIARTSCRLVFVDRERFLFLIQETPLFALQIIRSFSTRLRQLKQKF